VFVLLDVIAALGFLVTMHLKLLLNGGAPVG
jgi:hypothetical protein